MGVLFCITLALTVGLEYLGLLQCELHQVSHKWYPLGVQLQIPVGTLKRIESDHRQTTRCLLEMLTEWLNCTNPPPTWNALIKALESSPVDERHLAQQLRDQYCQRREGGVTHDFHTQGPSPSEAHPTPQNASSSSITSDNSVGCVGYSVASFPGPPPSGALPTPQGTERD